MNFGNFLTAPHILFSSLHSAIPTATEMPAGPWYHVSVRLARISEGVTCPSLHDHERKVIGEYQMERLIQQVKCNR
jgi:hypothetical protein